MQIFQIVFFVLGVNITVFALSSEVKTFVLPRSAPDPISRIVFTIIRRVFNLFLHWAKTYETIDQVMAYYAPISLLMLVPAWLTLVLLGYTAMFWSVLYGTWDGQAWYHAFRASGSALFTLGFEPVQGAFTTFLTLSEAAIGLIVVAMLIAYLPTMYAAFSRREAAVSLLEVRAGNPPSALEMILRYHRNHGLDALTEQWRVWEAWFADIEESHTSLPALVFFRSPQSDHSWVTASGAILDAAALSLAAVDIPYDPQAALCIRAGFIALRRIADFFGVVYNPNPAPTDPISIHRSEFDDVLTGLVQNKVPLKADFEQAWKDYSGWRVNYDTVLIALAALTLAPNAPWSSDRQHKPIINPPIWKTRD